MLTASRVGYHIALGFGQAMNMVNCTECLAECSGHSGVERLRRSPTSINISRKDIWNISLRWEKGCRSMSESL